jgi:hypothetical protein
MKDERINIPAVGVDGNAGELPPEKEIRYKPIQERVRMREETGKR